MWLILASASPRRQELLRDAGLVFDVVPSRLPETPRTDESPEAAVERLAREKALHVARQFPGCPVLAADTAVVLDEAFLGKPADAEDARRMLRALSGREHRVLTGYALTLNDDTRSAVCTTRVSFRDLTDGDIDAYIATGEPMDKAGAYAIQGEGAHLVRERHGSRDNVIGLPVDEVLALCHEMKIV